MTQGPSRHLQPIAERGEAGHRSERGHSEQHHAKCQHLRPPVGPRAKEHQHEEGAHDPPCGEPGPHRSVDVSPLEFRGWRFGCRSADERASQLLKACDNVVERLYTVPGVHAYTIRGKPLKESAKSHKEFVKVGRPVECAR